MSLFPKKVEYPFNIVMTMICKNRTTKYHSFSFSIKVGDFKDQTETNIPATRRPP